MKIAPARVRAILARCGRTPTTSAAMHKLLGGSIASLRSQLSTLVEMGALSRPPAPRGVCVQYRITPEGERMLAALAYTPAERAERMHAAALLLAHALGYRLPEATA